MTRQSALTGSAVLRSSKKESFGEDLRRCYAGKRILVTGGTGFLGSNLIRLLADVKCELLSLRRQRSAAFPPSGAIRVKEKMGDIRERATWEQILEGVDFVFHLAAQTSLAFAEENPTADFAVNVLPMLHLIEICREKNFRPAVLFAGTVTEAGIPTRLPVDEAHPDHPITMYDLHKWLAEQYLKLSVRQGILSGAILRLANVYGPGPESTSPERGVLNQMIQRAIRGEALTVYGRGEELRDYLYIEDAARAFLAAGVHIERVNGHHFVIGSGEGRAIVEAFHLVAEQVSLTTGRRVEVKHIDPPKLLSPIEGRNFVADSRKFSQMTGWAPETPFRKGIAKTIEAFQ